MDDSLFFDESHLATREMVREFAREEVAPVAAKLDADAKFPWDNIRKMADLGLLGVPWSEELGGAGLDTISFMIAIHELAKVAVIGHSERSSLVHIRLLATAERIKAELGEDSKLELFLLRSLWRRAGDRLYDGAVVDAAAFPTGYGGTRGVLGILDRLQSRQFLVWSHTEPGSRLARPDLPLDFFRIDWQAMSRRLAADLAKLDAMQRYSYLKKCRREFVLRYFGDAAAKPRCKGCDVCLGIELAKRTTGRLPRRRRRA